jgi:hypothetical protein
MYQQPASGQQSTARDAGSDTSQDKKNEGPIEGEFEEKK